MPDRTIAPAIQAIERTEIKEAKFYNLENGLPLYYLAAGQQPVLRLEIIFHAGKWYENFPGISYFTGKMLTEGTENRSAAEVSSFFDDIGIFLEVTPGFDRVTLTLHLLRKYLAQTLPVIAEMIYQPAFRADELQNIKQIKKQRLLVDLQKTSFVAAQKFTEVVFGKQHPYGKSLDSNSIDNTSVESAKKFYHQLFDGNYELVLSGKVNEEDLNQVSFYLGQAPKSKGNSVSISMPSYRPQEITVDKDDSLQSSIRIGMPLLNRDHPDFIELLVVNEILGGYFGSRLMRNIREDKGFTYGIHSGISCLSHSSLWAVSSDVKKEFREQTIEEVVKEIQILRNKLVPQEELDTVKNYMLGAFISQIDTPFALADKFKTIHYSNLDYQYYHRYFQKIKDISRKRVKELAQKYLVLENMSRIVVG